MKKTALILGLLAYQFIAYTQVGIGTTTPNSKSILDIYSHSKGLLIPRMTGAERNLLGLGADDMGMIVFQTDLSSPPYAPSPKGFYAYDGSTWTPPLVNGASNGETLKWDGAKWIATNTLFNTGSAIGIGTTAPKSQMQIHSTQAPFTRLQITNANTMANTADGLVLGISLTNQDAHLIQQEEKPLWFGTKGIERMRIDSAGNVGINKTNPSAKLDVNGSVKAASLDVSGTTNVANLNVSGTTNITSLITSGNTTVGALTTSGPVKLGNSGTPLNTIIRSSQMVNIPLMLGSTECLATLTVPSAVTTATVHVSPSESMSNIMIGYSRVSAPNTVEIKFINLSLLPVNPADVMFYVTVIQ